MTPRPRRTKALVILLLVTIALALALVYRLWPTPEITPVPPAAPVATLPVAPVATPTGTDTGPTVAETAPQRRPAGKSRLVDLLPLLQAQADAGDAAAACRLSVQLLSCQSWLDIFPQFEDQLAEHEGKAHAEGRLDEADQAASVLLRVTEQRQRCEGVSELATEGASDYLRQSALAGHPEAMIRYARGDGLGHHGNARFITSDHFDQWRREALPMLERLLAEGRPEAILLMLEAHSTHGRLNMLVPSDPVTSVASLALARRVFGDQKVFGQLQTADGLDAAQRADARALAADMHQRHFGNRRHDYAPATRPLQPLFDPYGYGEWPLQGAVMDPADACAPSAAGEAS